MLSYFRSARMLQLARCIISLLMVTPRCRDPRPPLSNRSISSPTGNSQKESRRVCGKASCGLEPAPRRATLPPHIPHVFGTFLIAYAHQCGARRVPTCIIPCAKTLRLAVCGSPLEDVDFSNILAGVALEPHPHRDMLGNISLLQMTSAEDHPSYLSASRH